MAELLLFGLWAPLGAMGDLAVGEQRGSAQHPARSAVLGLLGAALGVERADGEGQAALQAGYGVAVRVLSSGRLLRDYHTAQVPPARTGRRRGERWKTRRDELADARVLSTILSTREYREETAATVALWRRPGARWALEEMAAALRCPHFALYLGRKACPLGLPPAPRVIGAEDLAMAFRHYDAARPDAERLLHRRLRCAPGAAATLHADIDPAMPPGPAARSVERRRDLALDRRLWTFGERDELTADLPAPPIEGARP